MDHESLVEANYAKGERVLQALSEDEISVELAFWAKLSIYDDWRLFVISPTLDRHPLLEAYGRVSLALDGKFIFSEPPVIVLRSNDPFPKSVLEEVRKHKDSHLIRLPGGQFGNRYIEEGYAYPSAGRLPVQ